MTVPPVPPPTWVRFCLAELSAAQTLTTKIDRYRVEELKTLRGAPVLDVTRGASFLRLESTVELPGGGGDLVGVTQHLVYTRSAERPDLVSTPITTNAICVVIPLTKHASWWQLAQDERDAMFRGAGRPGHVEVGLGYARTILRKLYHSRPIPGAGWDFVTYFEFLPENRRHFETLLLGLRDPERNPEWNYVERESEIWLSRT